jgi:hypothetical protein
MMRACQTVGDEHDGRRDEGGRARLGRVDDTAFARRTSMTDDELVAYLDGVMGTARPPPRAP